MNLIRMFRWEPFREMVALSDHLNRVMGDMTPYSPVEGVGAWIPPVDIIEEADRLVFRAEVPGVSREDLDISIEAGTLMLRGEKKQEKEVAGESAHRVERYYGSFSRSFSLPTTVAADRITATCKDGVLEIVLPKSDEARPRKVSVLGA